MKLFLLQIDDQVIGVFSSREKAEDIKDKLAAAGFEDYEVNDGDTDGFELDVHIPQWIGDNDDGDIFL